jgi:hypothetical protein
VQTSESESNPRTSTTNATAPTTNEGKAISSRNAVKHGLCSRRLTGPDQEEYLAILEALHTEWEPQFETEFRLLDHMALNQWRMGRALSLELTAFDDEHLDQATLNLALRYRVSAERAFYRALKELQSLRRHTRAETAAIEKSKQRQLEQELDRLIMGPIIGTPPPSPAPQFVSQNAHAATNESFTSVPASQPKEFVSQNQPEYPRRSPSAPPSRLPQAA